MNLLTHYAEGYSILLLLLVIFSSIMCYTSMKLLYTFNHISQSVQRWGAPVISGLVLLFGVWFIYSGSHSISIALGLFFMILGIVVNLIIFSDQKKIFRDIQKYKQGYDHNPDSVCTLDMQGIITSVNKGTIELLGRSKEQLVGVSFLKYVHPDDIELAQIHFQNITEGRDSQIEFSIVRQDGDRIYIMSTGSPIKMNGVIVGVSGFGKDISEQKKLLRKLMEHDTEYKSLFESNMHTIFLIDEDNKIVTVNHSMQKMLGYNKDQLIGKYFSDFFTTESPEHIHQKLEKNTKRQMTTYEMIMINKYGIETNVAVSFNPVYFEERYRGTYCKVRDISYRKHLERVLQEKIDRGITTHDPSDPGRSLRVIMAQKDINTTELAEMTGLSLATISNLRTGKITRPQISTAQCISVALGVNIKQIWSIDEFDLNMKERA
jgi:PAS domain S-box-containing protein